MSQMTALVLANGRYYPFGGDAGDNRDLTIRLIEFIRQALCQRSACLQLEPSQLPGITWAEYDVLPTDPTRLADIELHLYWPHPSESPGSRTSDANWSTMCLQVVCLAIQSSSARDILVDSKLNLKVVLHRGLTEARYLILIKGDCLEFEHDHAKSAW